jgi:hypothetical protein
MNRSSPSGHLRPRSLGRGEFLIAAIAALLIPVAAARSDDVPPPTPQSAVTVPEAPRLAGIWKLNEKESETLEKKMQERAGSGGRREGGGRMGGGPPGGMGGGGRGGRGGGSWGGGGGGRGSRGHGDFGGGDRGDSGPARNPEMRELAHPAQTLLIEQVDSSFVLSEKGITLQTLVLAGKAPVVEGAPGESPRYQAYWSQARLMAARQTSRGGRMNETFELAGDGKSLVIHTSLELRPDAPPLELKRVYDRYEGD